MSQTAKLAFTIAICCTLHYAKAQAQDNPDIRQQFLSDAPKAWERVQERAKRLQGSFSVKSILESGKMAAHEKSALKQAPGYVLYNVQSILAQDNDLSGRLRATNPHYSFELRRADQTKNWTVSKVALNAIKAHPFDDLFQRVEALTNAPMTFMVLSEFELAENKGFWPIIIKEPGFSLKTVSPQTHLGKQWVKLDFIYHPNAKSSRVPSLVIGWALLDPERDWCIQEYGIQLERAAGTKVTHAAKYYYDELRGGFPNLRRMDISYTNHTKPEKTFKIDFLYEFDLREADGLAEEFTLSHFGFPEPVGVILPKPTRWWLWLSLGAGGSFCIAILFAKLKRRYSNVEPVNK